MTHPLLLCALGACHERLNNSGGVARQASLCYYCDVPQVEYGTALAASLAISEA
jgi:hypothetical protein